MEMKSIIILLFTALFVSIMVIDVQSSTPIAPPAFGNPEKIPSKEEVGVPIPENTYFIHITESKDTINETNYIYYEFVTENTVDEAISFYLDNLDEMIEWNYNKQFKVFYIGEEEFSFKKRYHTLSIIPASESWLSQMLPKQSKLRDKVKSRIIISYLMK
jgi:hypothetical protein